MAKKKKNKKRLVTFYCDPQQWQELPNNINCSSSEFLRQCISKQINKSDKVTELRKKLIELENEKKLIEFEIKDTKEEIYNLEQIQINNENNTILILNKMDIIKTVAENENGITEQRIITIANDEIKPYILIKEAKKQGIKIIDKDKQSNSKTIKQDNESKPETKEQKLNKILKRFNRHLKSFNSSNQYNKMNAFEFLEKNKDHYYKMCEHDKINFNDLLNHIKNNNDNEKE